MKCLGAFEDLEDPGISLVTPIRSKQEARRVETHQSLESASQIRLFPGPPRGEGNAPPAEVRSTGWQYRKRLGNTRQQPCHRDSITGATTEGRPRIPARDRVSATVSTISAGTISSYIRRTVYAGLWPTPRLSASARFITPRHHPMDSIRRIISTGPCRTARRRTAIRLGRRFCRKFVCPTRKTPALKSLPKSRRRCTRFSVLESTFSI